MENAITSFFTCHKMIKEEQIRGEIPSSKAIYKETIKLSWPSALERVLVGLVGSVDTIMVGVLGSSSIAAVGLTQQPTFIVLAVIFSLNVGVTAIVARRCGEKDYESANRCLRQSIVLVGLIALFLSVIGFMVAEPVIQWMGAESDTLQDAVDYFRIIMIGTFFTAMALNINAVQRGAGNTRIALVTNLVANVINLILNYLLIGGHFGFPALGVRGAAIATVTGNIVSFFIAFGSLIHPKNGLQLSFKANWRFDKRTLRGILGISSSALVEQMAMRVGFLMYTRLVADLGTVAFATHQICNNIISVTFNFGDGMGMAASSLVGRSLGRKRPDMSIIYGKAAQRIALLIASVLFFVYIGARVPLVSLFTQETAIVTLGSEILIIAAFIAPLQISQVVVSGALRGAGDTRFVAVSSLISIGILRPIVTWILCYPFAMGLVGAWIAFLMDQIVRLGLNLIRFSNGKWTTIQL